MSLLIYNKKTNKFNFFSTITDTFVFSQGLTHDQVIQYIQEEYGKEGMSTLGVRIVRAKEKGHTCRLSKSLDEALEMNKCGKDDSELTPQACLDKFVS